MFKPRRGRQLSHDPEDEHAEHSSKEQINLNLNARQTHLFGSFLHRNNTRKKPARLGRRPSFVEKNKLDEREAKYRKQLVPQRYKMKRCMKLLLENVKQYAAASQFQKHAFQTNNPDKNMIETFMTWSGCESKNTAKHYIKICNNDLNKAVNQYLGKIKPKHPISQNKK
jgi:hypothetical protein